MFKYTHTYMYIIYFWLYMLICSVIRQEIHGKHFTKGNSSTPQPSVTKMGKKMVYYYLLVNPV